MQHYTSHNRKIFWKIHNSQVCWKCLMADLCLKVVWPPWNFTRVYAVLLLNYLSNYQIVTWSAVTRVTVTVLTKWFWSEIKMACCLKNIFVLQAQLCDHLVFQNILAFLFFAMHIDRDSQVFLWRNDQLLKEKFWSWIKIVLVSDATMVIF